MFLSPAARRGGGGAMLRLSPAAAASLAVRFAGRGAAAAALLMAVPARQAAAFGTGMPVRFRTRKVRDVRKLQGQGEDPSRWQVSEDATVFEATAKMVQNKVGALCVERGGSVVGIITERDYLTKILHAGRKSRETKVAEICTKDDALVLASLDDTLQDCIDVMCSRNFRRLPVADRQGVVVGLLSITDITKELAAERLEAFYHKHHIRVQQTMPIHDG
jgi:predicted transcriptional regulator